MIAAYLHVYLQHMNQKEFLPLHSFQYTDGKNWKVFIFWIWSLGFLGNLDIITYRKFSWFDQISRNCHLKF